MQQSGNKLRRSGLIRGRLLAAVLGGALVVGVGCRGGDKSSESIAPPASESKAARIEGAEAGATAAATRTATPTSGSPTVAATRTPAPTATTAAPRSPTTTTGLRLPTPGPTPVPVTPHPDTPDPCRLVTAAEATTALGGPPLPPSARRSRDTAEVRCTYTYLAAGRSLAVSVWKGSEARPVYDLRRTEYGRGGAVEELRGLGDQAFSVKGDEGWVNVLKGDVYLSIQLGNDLPTQPLSEQELRDRALAAARTAVGRL